MESVYQKVNAICVHTLLSYDDYSQIQICYDNTRKSFNLYTAYPDAEEGSQFIRDMFWKYQNPIFLNSVNVLKK